jgi:hypothetical protein
MNLFSFYDRTSGNLTGAFFYGETAPEVSGDLGCVPGQWPADRYRVIDGKLVEYVPEKPEAADTAEYEWDASLWRWVRVLTIAGMWQEVRHERNRRLAACDWTQMPDVDLRNAESWQAYRQALRDITGQSDPNAIQWPDPPSAL